MTVPLLRGILAGLLAFMLFGWLFARVVSALTPGEWSVDALNLAGLAALVVDGAVGGAVGAWQSSRAGLRGPAALLGAVLGPLIATLAIIASRARRVAVDDLRRGDRDRRGRRRGPRHAPFARPPPTRITSWKRSKSASSVSRPCLPYSCATARTR